MTQQHGDVASKVKALRGRLGVSQDELTKALGVSFATVNRWENGKTSPSKLAKNQFELFCLEQEKLGML
ncbi:MAG: helix-turn-helix transcriptional regulator [Gammaproteobacteria bacterium]|nr:helix-turn-helix transcriptional regulator [Gammaproteobacteria bacterium]MBQ0774634.1 helix-turn-helix transcriptional regulator [Gammaproteobacteria bacterium]